VNDNLSVSGARVLVVEHDLRLRESITAGLGLIRYTCEPVEDGVNALRQAAQKPFDLVLVDLDAPEVNRLQICRTIRQTANRHVPIVVLAPDTALSAVLTEIEHGADDFLMKPFGHHELTVRARAAIHRARGGTPPSDRAAAPDRAQPVAAPPLAHGDIRLDPARRHVSVGDRPVQLTEHEFHLLYVLAGHPGIVFSRDKLLARVWGQNRYVTVRSVDTLVSRLRRRIEPNVGDDPRYIRTVRGVGYKLGEA
jgi:DNA-binding response OmpR family regulator